MTAATDSQPATCDRGTPHATIYGQDDQTVVVATRTDRHVIRHGYGVFPALVHAGDDEPEPDAVVAADVIVVRISFDTIEFIGGLPCVRIEEGTRFYVPAENFAAYEDAPDRLDAATWHATRDEAVRDAEDLVSTWSRRGVEATLTLPVEVHA
jgi:hypothetical protein